MHELNSVVQFAFCTSPAHNSTFLFFKLVADQCVVGQSHALSPSSVARRHELDGCSWPFVIESVLVSSLGKNRKERKGEDPCKWYRHSSTCLSFGSPRQALLKLAVLHVVPNVNPDGSHHGARPPRPQSHTLTRLGLW